MKPTVAVIGITLLLTCCRAPSGKGNQFQPIRLNIEGPYTHAATGIELPTKAGDFTRIGVTQYDKGATDVSGHYELASSSKKMSVTLYVYPAPKVMSFGSPDDVVAAAKANVLANHLAGLKAEILGAHAQASLVAEEQIALPIKNGELRGNKIEFQFTTNSPIASFPAASFLYLFERGDWLIKIRATAHRDLRDELEDAVGGFAADLSVPGKISHNYGSMGGRGSRRAAAPPISPEGITQNKSVSVL